MNGKDGVLAQNLVVGDKEFEKEQCEDLNPREANAKEIFQRKKVVTRYLAQVPLILSQEHLPYSRFHFLLYVSYI